MIELVLPENYFGEELNLEEVKAQAEERAHYYIDCVKGQAYKEGYAKGSEVTRKETLEELVEKITLIKDERVNGEYTHNRAYRGMLEEVLSIIDESRKPQRTFFGCVDCDSCEHRSEDNLCELSNNSDGCPLVDDGK